ncbi:MAG: hypothetical protein IJK18_04815 [Clostridia bacterium]|nr:hypothetical protein [Clostridia bacterium]
MENASKALIIAGAILLSILIISLGIVVVNNTRTTIDKANVNQQVVSTFNSQFEAYIGNTKSASDVRNLVSVVNSSNGAEYTNKTYHYVAFAYKSTTLPGDPGHTNKPTVNMPKDLVAGKTYTIEVGYDGDGYVNRIRYAQNP